VEFTVIIATRDRARFLGRALESLYAQQGAPSYEVIVVDNGSSDDTMSVVDEASRRFPNLRCASWRQPNRGGARNRGAAIASGSYLLFCDDDVYVPAHWISAHAAAHAGEAARVVNGPILNVASYDRRPIPTVANYSRAFLCTCNASLSKAAFLAAGGFDERFDLYGWEDTELGIRLRDGGARWTFAWDAYLWHVKPREENTLTEQSRKIVEKARMAQRFLAKHPSRRARLATGAHPLNLLRGRYLLPEWLLALCAGLTESERAPAWVRAAARAQFLDALYIRELARALRDG
jgi:GT2 family glycosyltransferase